MELEVSKGMSIDDGKHEGVISKVADKTTEQGYKYVDVFVKEKESGFEIKYGCPENTSIESKLMKLLKVFKPDLEIGQKVDPEAILKDKNVTFMTMQEAGSNGGKFVKIVEGSLKPL